MMNYKSVVTTDFFMSTDNNVATLFHVNTKLVQIPKYD